jgi:hypothetical protein
LDCTLCHYSEFDNLDAPGGRVEILDVPAAYSPGAVYPIRVRLRSDSTASSPSRRWGFQLTAVRGSDGEGVGTFLLPSPDTLQVVTGLDFASRSYVEHRLAGTRPGLGGPVEWMFSWQAPSVASGKVYFFCAGNAADGTGDTYGDFIYTARDSSVPAGSVDVDAPVAKLVSLAAPRPNPALDGTNLEFVLPVRSRVELAVFDLHGRQVRDLVSGWRDAGVGRVFWDARGDDGRRAADGIYFARLNVAGSPAVTRKVILGR